jgi:hypothetical protein
LFRQRAAEVDGVGAAVGAGDIDAVAGGEGVERSADGFGRGVEGEVGGEGDGGGGGFGIGGEGEGFVEGVDFDDGGPGGDAGAGERLAGGEGAGGVAKEVMRAEPASVSPVAEAAVLWPWKPSLKVPPVGGPSTVTVCSAEVGRLLGLTAPRTRRVSPRRVWTA